MLLETLVTCLMNVGCALFELVSLNYFCVCVIVSIVMYNQRE